MAELLYLLEVFIPNLIEVIETVGIIMLIFGLIEASFGYKIFKVILAIFGFLIGACIGGVIFFYTGHGFAGSENMTAYMLVGGLIGSALAESVHKLGVFLSVGTMSTFIFFLMTQDMQASLIFGIVCGIVGILLEKYVVIVMTGISGGALLANGIWVIGISKGENWNVQIIGWIIGGCGVIFQLWLEKRKFMQVEDERGEGLFGLIIVFEAAGNSIKSLIQRMKTANKSGELKPVLVKSFVGLPIIVGIISGILFKSFLFGISVIALLYIIVMIQFVRMQREKILPGKYMQKFAWEKWANSVLDNNIFILFCPLSLGLFFYSIFSEFVLEGVSFVIAIAGTIGVYYSFFKALSKMPLKEQKFEPLSMSGEMQQNRIMRPENILLCQNCRAVLTNDSAFCYKCGFRVQTKNVLDYKFCIMCGTKLPDDAMFCDKCGSRQND